MSSEFVFEARDVQKTYGATKALAGVDFRLKRGEIRGLIGSNGAGKSTLFKIVAGVETPTSGELRMAGKPVSFSSVRDAAAAGVVLIHQELSLFPDLSVAENIHVGREKRGRFGLVDHGAQQKAAREALALLGSHIDPSELVRRLPVGMQQITEIARAISQEVQVLLMDEPTSALGRAEVEQLFQIIRKLASEGVAIVYVSHRLDELLEICDTLTVLRDGAVVAECEAGDVDPAWIVERMTGRAEAITEPPSADHIGPVILEGRGLSLGATTNRAAVCDLNFELRAGEVLGVFGLMGAGRTELLEAIMGLHHDLKGDIVFRGDPLGRADVSRRIALGLAMLTEDRQRTGLIGPASVLHNMSLSILDRLAPRGLVNARKERAFGEAMVSDLGIKLPGLDAPIRALSGGNQQKVLLARNLLSEPAVLLLDEPTRGVDAAAKADILKQVHNWAEKGVAVIVTSSEPAEILAASTRVLVMSRGRFVLEKTPAELNEAALLEAASVESLEGKRQ